MKPTTVINPESDRIGCRITAEQVIAVLDSAYCQLVTIRRISLHPAAYLAYCRKLFEEIGEEMGSASDLGDATYHGVPVSKSVMDTTAVRIEGIHPDFGFVRLDWDMSLWLTPTDENGFTLPFTPHMEGKQPMTTENGTVSQGGTECGGTNRVAWFSKTQLTEISAVFLAALASSSPVSPEEEALRNELTNLVEVMQFIAENGCRPAEGGNKGDIAQYNPLQLRAIASRILNELPAAWSGAPAVLQLALLIGEWFLWIIERGCDGLNVPLPDAPVTP